MYFRSPDNDTDDESHSNKSYKKKLQKKLFNETANNSDTDILENSHSKKAKKNKHVEDSQDSSENISPKHMKVKVEPENDNDSINEKDEDGSIDTEQHVNEYIVKRMKEEQHSFIEPSTHKTKKKQNVSIPSNHSDTDRTSNISIDNQEIKKKSKKKKDKCRIENENSFNNTLDSITDESYCDTSIKKSKKKKNKERKNVTEDELMDDNDNSVSYITDKKEKKKKKSKNVNEVDELDKSIASLEHNSTNPITKNSRDNDYNNDVSIVNNNGDHRNLISDHNDAGSSSNEQNHKIVKHKSNVNNVFLNQSLPDKILKRSSRLSDKIQFEDDSDKDSISDNEITVIPSNENSDVDDTLDKHLLKYVQRNPDFKVVKSKMLKGAVLSNDDDIWLLECPNEIDINDLKDKSLDLENKCKIKINDQTYIGRREDDTSHITVLSSQKRKHIIKNVPIKGTIRLHKRKRKQHFVVDENMVNSNNFVPLPEIKCRHPLFGPNYKNAMKLPISIREQLQETEASPSQESKKKKVKKEKERINSQTQEVEDIKVKKSKKRKHKSSEGNDSPVKKKKSKIKPDSSEAWESERAIEENLFNF